jgi:hypothetical protein
MDSRQTILEELDRLIVQGVPIGDSYHRSLLSPRLTSGVPEWKIREFVTGASAAIDRVAGRESQFYRQIVLQPGSLLAITAEVVMSVLGSLRSLREAVDKGHLVTLQQLARAEVLDDFMTQSRALLDAGYHVAAMVLIGGVLEEHLGKLCLLRNVLPASRSGLSVFNDALRGVVFDQPQWRRVQALADLRNQAAHGQGAKVGVPDVEDAWVFVNRILADVPS